MESKSLIQKTKAKYVKTLILLLMFFTLLLLFIETAGKLTYPDMYTLLGRYNQKDTFFDIQGNKNTKLDIIQAICENSSSLQILYKEIAELPYVKTTRIMHRLPDLIKVDITEYTPIAINEASEIFNIDGDIISKKNNTKIYKENLIKLEGNPTKDKLQEIIKIIMTDYDLFDKVKSINFIGNRRWNIIFSNGITIRLPQADPKKAWDYVILNQSEILESKADYLDLRISNKLFLKTKK